MQSAIWKAVALAGVIGIGCYVVYEVHRRLPAPQSDQPTTQQFKQLEENSSTEPGDGPARTASADPQSDKSGTDSNAGDSAAFDPFGGGWDDPQTSVTENPPAIPAQSEPEEMASAAPATAPPDEQDAPWSRIDQRSAPSDSTGDTPFTPRAMPALAHEGEGTDSPEGLFGSNDQEPIVDEASPTLAGQESAHADAATAAGVVPRGVAPGDVASDPAAGVHTAAGAASPRTATLADFTGDEAGASAAATADSASDATDLFAPDLGEGSDSPILASPAPAAEPVAEPEGLGDTLPESTGDGQATSDPPMLPPSSSADPFAPFESTGDSAESPGGSDSAPAVQESSTFTGDSPATEGGGPPHPPLNLVLPLDEPAEFPLGDGAAEATPMPAQEDATPFVITPARELTPPAGASENRGAPARLDFVGDGTISEETPPGPQQPELKVEKVAPAEATVGEPLVYAIRVTNTGRSAAHDVVVEDRIPRGTTLDGTIPRAELSDKRLTWRLGTIEPGGEQMIRIRVVPNEAGEIGSVATVRFVAEVSAATVITRPELALEMNGPQEAAVGEQVVFHFVVTNRGSGDARDVIIRSLLPPGLEHPDGDDIEYPLGRIRAGESREIDLAVTARQPGQLRGQGLVTIGSKTYAQQESPVTVIPSRLLIRREGPARRFVNSKAEYVTTITNRSSRDLQQVTVEEQLPPGLELASMPEGAQFDRNRRTITWRFPLLPAGESTVVRTSLVGQSPGTAEIVMRAGDAGGNKAVLASRLEVAGVSSLAVDFSHDGRPVAVGEKVALKMTVTNRGTAPAQGVQALFEIPDNMEFVTADGPVEYEQEGRVVRFAAVDEIKASGKQTFDIVLTAAESGTQRVTAQLMAPNLSEPLRNDEAVVVEGDE